MPHPHVPKAGLGTSIVQALSVQLGGRVDIVDANPGTRVSVVHTYVPVLVQAGEQAARPV